MKRMVCVLLVCLFLLCACAETGETAGQSTQVTQESSIASLSDAFSSRDYEVGYDETECVRITLTGDGATCSSDAVGISEGVITIEEAGSYLLSGTLNNGMILVDAEDTDKVQLILDGVSIANDVSAAIYVRSADKVFLTTAADSENTFSNGGEYIAMDENNIDAVIFSKDDLTLNGEGSLKINAAAGHGIVSKDELTITSGSYDITAANHGLSGKDSVAIAGGIFIIESGKDGIHAENKDDGTLGALYIVGGNFDITAEGDAISAGYTALIEAGAFKLTAGGGSVNAEQKAQEQFGGGKGGFFPPQESSESEESISRKGIKAGSALTIHGGSFQIDTADDALHSNGSLSITDGDFALKTGDDGAHADENLDISGGTLYITQSYEGLEGNSIVISGGEIVITSTDDGLNAAGGNDESGFGGGFGRDNFGAASNSNISISGGVIRITASGDAIDSNGNVQMSGGEVYISGPSIGGNSSLDYAGSAVITGGVFIAAGSSQMAQSFGTGSTQGVILLTVGGQQSGTVISLTDAEAKTLLSYTAECSYDCVLISMPDIVQGESYTLSAGSASTEITMDTLYYGSGTGGQFGGMGGRPEGGSGKHEGFGGRPDGGFAPPEGGEAPSEMLTEPSDADDSV